MALSQTVESVEGEILEDHYAYNWSVTEVAEWLLDRHFKGKFDEYACIFREHEIDGEALLALTDSKLQEMGITIVGRRTKLYNAIKKLKKETDLIAQTYHQSTNNDKLKEKELKEGSYNEQNLHLMQDIDPIKYNFKKQKAIESAGGTQPNEMYSSILRKKRETANIIIQSIANSKSNLNNIQEQKQKTHSNRIKYDSKIPNFNNIKSENAIKYSWNHEENKWIKSPVTIKIALNPFENGSLRIAYYCILISDSQSVPNYDEIDNKNTINENSDRSGKNTFRHQSCDMSNIGGNSDRVISSLFGYEDIFGGKLCVLKKGNSLIDSQENSLNIYFNDVRTQIESKRFADEYNKYNPPKKITFLDCSVIQLIDRKPTQNDLDVYDFDEICKYSIHQFYNLEPYLFGRYTKHSNNIGWDDDKRNTPSAFTHFTLIASNNRLCVCDIQGVNDLYTDPQIHTYNGYGFGCGNRSNQGILDFIIKHKCNAICAHFKLLPYSKNIILNNKHKTIPQTRYMKNLKINIINTQFIDNINSFNIPTNIIYKPLQQFPSIIINNNNNNKQQSLNHIKSPLLNYNQNGNNQNNNNNSKNQKQSDSQESCCCWFCVVL